MRRVASFLLLFTLIPLSLQAQQTQDQSEIKEFHPLESSMQFGIPNATFTLTIKSEVRLVDHLASKKALDVMSDEEKGYVSAYSYTYTFKNEGPKKIRLAFGNLEVLMSPLFHFLQDFSIILEPDQERKVNFIANTTPKSVPAGSAWMIWFEEKSRWFQMGSGSSALYIPQWNAIYTEEAF